MRTYNIQILALLLVIILGLSACHTRKQVSQSPATETVITDPVDSLFGILKDNEFQFEWLKASFKAKADMSTGAVNISGQIRMRKDSVIWMSISPALGIEMLRLKITPDTVFLLNKLKKTFIREHIDYINKFLGTDLDFDMVQSLLVGNDFSYYSPKQFQVKETESDFVFHTQNRRKLKKHIDTSDIENLLIQKMFVSKATKRITLQDVKQVRNPNKRLMAQYSDYLSVGTGLFPLRQDIQIKGTENIRLDLSLSKIIHNEKHRFPFKIPKSYTQL